MRSADKKNHSSNTKVRTCQFDRGDDKHLDIRDKIRDDEYQPRGATTRKELFDVVEAHTFSLAYIQTGPDEIEPSDSKICSGCHEDAERCKVIGQRIVLDNRSGLVDSGWHKLQFNNRLKIRRFRGTALKQYNGSSKCKILM